MAEPGAAEEENGQGNSLWSNLKYYVLVFLVINTVSNFLKGNQEQTPIDVAQLNDPKIDTSTIKLTPNLANSSFIQIQEPENKFKTIKETIKDVNGEDYEADKLVKNIEQIIYENSLSPAKYYTPILGPEESIDLFFYINDNEEFKQSIDILPNWSLNNISINSKNSQLKNFNIVVPDSVKFNNASLYLHTFIQQAGHDEIVGYKQFQLNTFLKKKKQIKLHKLIGDDEEPIKEEEPEIEQPTEQPIVSYWHPNVTIAIVKPVGLIHTEQLPPPLVDVFPLDPLDRRDNLTGLVTQYFPILYQNKFWQLTDHMNEINSTSSNLELNLNIDFAPFWKVQALALFSDGMKQQQANPISGGLSDGSEIDAIKKILLDTNPYLLAITVAVSLLHTLLEFLAFKNDISHWRNKKNNVGVSVRSIVANVIQQLITLLYLLDNSEGTSFMILASQGVGILVEAWKITTIVKIDIEWNGIIPSINVTDKYELSETEEKTKEYDSIAFKYLYWVAVPLLFAYAIYSLLYKEHKSWYSFIVTTLVGFVYTYGFLTLVPSVYINYRLKSVAHVPKKAMAYKVVNTFIDDLFAFVIKMPWLHRLATLRDDVIFFIYLYQTWIYRVDYSRINEFGQGGDEDDNEDEDEGKEDKDGKKKIKNGAQKEVKTKKEPKKEK